MFEIPDAEIKNRLRFDNIWWESGEVDGRYRNWPRRAYLEGFMELVRPGGAERAVVLMGPRRVGKTVMIHQAIHGLMGSGVAARDILYLSADTPVYTGLSLETLLRHFQEIHSHERTAPLYVFFDEIQYHPEWELHLKSLVDSYPSIRFVASGSAAAALKQKSRESGAGRFTLFILPPLTFCEFLDFRRQSSLILRDVDRLNEQFMDYLNFGGFPEAVTDERVRADMGRYVADDIIDKVLLRDLPSLYGISDPQELNRIFTVLALNTGQEVNIESLSQSSNVSKNTLKKYLEYLEAAFLIQRLPRMDENAKRFRKQTNFKIYLTNPSLRAALFGAIGPDDPAMGQMAETAIVSQYAQSQAFKFLSYARWKAGEVGLIYRLPDFAEAIEVKWSDRVFDHPTDELKDLTAFCKKNGPFDVIAATTRTRSGEQKIGEMEIEFVPTSTVCYGVGRGFVQSELEAGSHPLTALDFINP
ncbi:MAG: ATP-binding protein [Rhodospirillales bacterium]|nr:ATP-binding protein [Rhodospirillales bacterium]